VRLSVDLDVMEQIKLSCSCRESNPDSSVVHTSHLTDLALPVNERLRDNIPYVNKAMIVGDTK
jgi:hypothetical protein